MPGDRWQTEGQPGARGAWNDSLPSPARPPDSVAPPSGAFSCRQTLSYMSAHLPYELGPRKGMPRVALGWAPVRECGVRLRIRRALEELLHPVHGDIQVEVVHVS